MFGEPLYPEWVEMSPTASTQYDSSFFRHSVSLGAGFNSMKEGLTGIEISAAGVELWIEQQIVREQDIELSTNCIAFWGSVSH